MKPRLYCPANDWCLALGDYQYADVIFSQKRGGMYTVYIRNIYRGRFKTKRLAKKHAKKLI
jgi:hypothetical protein